MATNYPSAKSKSSFEDGLEFQDWAVDRLFEIGIMVQTYSSSKHQFQRGESRQGVEIKLDNWCTRSKRLSIEIAEKSRADMPAWTPSGICRDDNTWLYVQGNYEMLFVFAKRSLLFLNELREMGVYGYEVHEEYGTLRAFYLPLDDALKHAAKVMTFGPQRSQS
jgi:hypothetical protein